MKGCISVINTGSSSIKFSLFDEVEHDSLRLIYRGLVEGIGSEPRFKARDSSNRVVAEESWRSSDGRDHEYLLDHVLDWLRSRRLEMRLDLVGVGHRVVHGGETYSKPVEVNAGVLRVLESYIPLAPLHQPHNLGSIRALLKLTPDTPQVACFDTAFHRTSPPVSQQFGIPRELADEGIKRFGFHGLSYEYVARRFRQMAPAVAAGRVIVAHLGSGASMCALDNGVSIASTMGFSAMDGLVMGTRPGNLDPGVVLHLIEQKGMSVQELSDLFYSRCGLLGVSGLSNDMRDLLQSDDPRAGEAVDLFVYRIQREIGSLTAALGGLDGLVFTAGIGENSAEIRSRVCETAGWLGLALDAPANQEGRARISTEQSAVSAWIVPTDEELMIATHTRDLLRERAVAEGL